MTFRDSITCTKDKERQFSGSVLYKMCSEKNMQNLQENTSVGVFFLTKLQTLLKSLKNNHLVENLPTAVSLSNTNTPI